MTHDHKKDDGCCGGRNKRSEQEQPKEENGDCCHDKDTKNPEKNSPDHSGGCCGGGKR